MRQTRVSDVQDNYFNLHFEKHELEDWLIRNRDRQYNLIAICRTCPVAGFLQEELRQPFIEVGFTTASMDKGAIVWRLPIWVTEFISGVTTEAKDGEEMLRIFHRVVAPDLPFSLPGGEL